MRRGTIMSTQNSNFYNEYFDEKPKKRTKMFKEDWRIVFECLVEHLDRRFDLDNINLLNSAEKNTLERRVVLCEKLLPKFLDPNSFRYKNCNKRFHDILSIL